MSAQKSPRRGVFSAAVGLVGFSALSGLLVTVMVAPALAVTGITASSTIGIFDSLPEYIEIGSQPERNEIWVTSTSDEAVDGKELIATIYDQNREEVSYDEISEYALNATTDGEDARFFEHGGVDVASVIRAAAGNVIGGGIESGASTLSMQLVKNTFVQEALEKPTEEERDAAYAEATAESFERKLKEMKLAIGLEKKYTKKEILTAYLNIANFGNATYGIQAAAQRYYSVDAKDLDPAQAASLIAIVQYPNSRNLADPENFAENQVRRDYILTAMNAAGHLTDEQLAEALATPVDETSIKLSDPENGCVAANEYARWFCDYVVKSVKDFEFLGSNEDERQQNWKHGGYKLYTTLDLDVQKKTQKATWKFAPNDEKDFSLGSATSTVEPGTGRVLVMAENKIFNDTLEGGGRKSSAVNYNTTFDYGGSTGFQPGSTYKVFTLLDWLAKGKGVEELVSGNPNTEEQASRFADRCNGPWGGTFSFKNNAGEKGNYTVRSGTVNSVNGVFFSMAKQLDLCDIRDVAASLGVVRGDGQPLETNPTSILGTNTVSPLSMASAYAGIAANGLWCKPIIVDSVINPDGSEGVGQTPECHQAIAKNVADTAIDVLKGVLTTGNQLYSNPGDGIPIFGKTGTTDSANHTWMAAATTEAASVTWVGNSIGEFNILEASYEGVPGILLRHYIMNRTLVALNKKYGGKDWPDADPKLLSGGGVEVPDVTGQSPEQAKTLLEGLGFIYKDGGEVDSDDIEIGLVAKTSPGAGSTSAKGATIKVYQSRGSNKVPLIDVVLDGQTNDFATALAQLNAAGYTQVTEACVPLEEGAIEGDTRIDKVQSTDPAPNTPVEPDTPVTVYVAKLVC